MTAAFLINPHSSGGGKKGKKLADVLRSSGQNQVALLDDFGDLRAILSRFADQGVTALFISSGDGTVQAVQTVLAEEPIFEENPALGIIPHGTTNMDALTLGVGLRNPGEIMAFAQDLSQARRTARHTVRVANPADGRPRHGMFVGAGALLDAVEFTQSAMNNNNIRGGLAPLATLIKFITNYLFSSGSSSIVHPHPMRIEVDGEPLSEGEHLAFFVSTLEKLVLRSRPYWGPDTSQMKVLSVAYPPPAVLRYIGPLMWGLPNRTLPCSCKSCSARHVEVSGAGKWVIDGEYFDAPEDEPLRLELGTEFTYVQAP